LFSLSRLLKMRANNCTLQERLRRKFARALLEFNQTPSNQAHYLNCVRILVSAFNDTADNFQPFEEHMCQPVHQGMVSGILNLCTRYDSLDYQVLRAVLLAVDQTFLAGLEAKAVMMTKAIEGLKSCLLVIGSMRDGNSTFFPRRTSITISKMYFFVALYFGRLRSEKHCLLYAQKALRLRADGEPGANLILDQIIFASQLGGICFICESRITQKCGGCQVLTYCSKHCQQEHWCGGHKEECKVITHLVETFAEMDVRE
jgi:hypothetical protein